MPAQVNLEEFVAGFLIEADEHLHTVNRNLVAVAEAVKNRRRDPRAVRELFRSLHTIKGLASMVGATPVVDVSHEMEGILRAADRGGGRLSDGELDALLQGTRAVEERVRAISKGGVQACPPAPRHVLEALVSIQNAQNDAARPAVVQLSLPDDIQRSLSAADREQLLQAASLGRRVVLLEFQPSAEKAAAGLNITAARAHLAKLGDLVKVVPRSAPAAPTGIAFFLLLVTAAEDAALAEAIGGSPAAVEQVTVTLSKTSDSAPPPDPDLEPAQDAAAADYSIRVDVRRLDEALEQLSALIVTRFKLSRAAADLATAGADTRELGTIISEHTRQLERLRTALTKARMVLLSELLQRLPLVVRGLTKDTAKSVNFVLRAGTAEVDKAVADRIFPAVVHLVRNAVDHALETRAERQRANKPEAGNLCITCDDSSGTSLVLTVSDDGRGIDREAVATRLGQPPAHNDYELLRQIAMPGLSTRDDVTHASGRGMGMDIVKRTIEALGGTLQLQTRAGQGTSFTLRVPVSVTIVDVLSFVSSGQVFVAPVAMVDEIIEIDPARLVKAPVPSRTGLEPHLVRRRGETIPLFGLGSLLERRPRQDDVSARALVVMQETGAIAFGVDRMLGQQEAVVRPLDDVLVRVPGITGATDLGDGRPTLVLDLATLGRAVTLGAATQ